MKVFFIFAINEIKTSLENLNAENRSLKNKSDDLISNKYIANQSQIGKDGSLITQEDFNATNCTNPSLIEQEQLTKTESSTFVIIEETSVASNNSNKNHDYICKPITPSCKKKTPSFQEYFRMFNGCMFLGCLVMIFLLLSLAFFYYKIGNHKKVWTSLLAIGIIPTMIIIGAIISGIKSLKTFK